MNLHRTCLAIERGYLGRKIYSPSMGGNLRRIFLKHSKMFENSIVDVEAVKRTVTIRDFDEQVTRRVFKYRTVHEYYRMASSSQRILDIKRPFLCLNALDDPVAVAECLPVDEIRENPFGLLATTSRGGHLGWFEGFWSQERWCTRPLAEFCLAMFEADSRPVSLTPSMKPAQSDESNESHATGVTIRKQGSDGATTMHVRHIEVELEQQQQQQQQPTQHHKTNHHSQHPNELQKSPAWSKKSFWATIVPLVVYYLMKRR